MKQFVFLIVVTLVGAGGALFYSPFLGVIVYWFYAVLRPQYMWQWALISYPVMKWSFIVAIPTMIAAALQAFGSGESSNGADQSRFSRTHWWVMLYGVIIAFSYFVVADNKSFFVYQLFEDYMKLFIMFVVSAILIQNLRQVWILYLMAAAVLGYIAYEINIEYLLKRSMGIYHNGYGGLDNNGAGLMLAMGVPLCYFAWQAANKWWRWGFMICVPGIVHSVLMTYSRGAMVALITVVPFLFFRAQRKSWFIVFGIAMAFLLPIMAGAEIRKRFFSIEQHDTEKTAKSRRVAWEAAIDCIKDHPVVGIGLRNSGPYVLKRTNNTAVHNHYLQVGADTGLMGLGVYLAVLASTWFGLRRVRNSVAGRDDEEAVRLRALANGIEGAMVVYCAGAMFLSLEVFELPYFLILLGAQLALLVRQQDLARAEEAERLAWMSMAAPREMAWQAPQPTFR
jgi:probable O-glycosylation ligase (exosortase A-associated)